MPKYKMAGKFKTKRNYRKKNYRKRKMYRRRAGFGNGGFTIVRKLPMVYVKSTSAIGGIPNVTDPTGSLITLGVPQATPIPGLWDVPFVMKFQLNQLQQYTDLTQIADMYKITKAHVRITSAFQASFQAGAMPPAIEYDYDYDDATVPTVNSFRERMGQKVKQFGPTRTSVSMSLTPRPNFSLAGTTPAFSVPRRSPWINSAAASDCPHFGVKGIIRNYLLNGNTDQDLLNIDVALRVAVKDLQ